MVVIVGSAFVTLVAIVGSAFVTLTLYPQPYTTLYLNPILTHTPPPRFREDALTFKVSQNADGEGEAERLAHYAYPSMTKTMTQKDNQFILHVEAGEYNV